jgi:hypothetical protein
VLSEFKGIWEEAVVAYFRVLSLHSPGGTEENHREYVRIVGCQVEIQARYPCHRFSRLSGSKLIKLSITTLRYVTLRWEQRHLQLGT